MSEEARYLFLSEDYALPPAGGHVVWLHEVARRLGGVRLLAGRRPQLPERTVYDGIDMRFIPLHRWRWVRPESLPLYVRFFVHGLRHGRRHPPRAVLAARILPEGLVANAVAHRLDVPSVVLAHGEEVNRLLPGKALRKRRRLTSALKRRFLWNAYRAADRIVANSRNTAELLAAGGIDPDKVAVVHPGTDPERFRPMGKDAELVRRYGLEGKKVVLTLGRLVIRKGQDMLIRALPRIRARVPEAVYLIVGRGGYESELRALARAEGVNDSVRFAGPADDADLPAVHNLADVFAMPNRLLPGSGDLEGFGIVFLEAGACEVPVVGGRSGGVPDAIDDGRTGLLVDGDRVEEIADAVVRILSEPALARRMGRAGRRRVLDELTWDHSAERIRLLIDDAAARRGSGAPA